MNIIVLLCDGIFGQKPVYIDHDGKLYEKNLYYVTNPSDLYAMDLAMKMKHEVDDAYVTAISIGNARASNLVKKSLLIGADRGIWGDCTNVALENAYAIGSILSNIIERYCHAFDILLMGNCSQDFEFGVVGSTLARRLDVEMFDNISYMENMDQRKFKEHKSIIFHKIMEKGDRLICESHAPLIISVSGFGKGMKGALLGDILRNMEKKIEVVNVEEMVNAAGVQGSRRDAVMAFQGYLEPRPRPKKIPVPDGSLNAGDRLKNITAGNMAKKAVNMFEGEPERVAAEFVRCISMAGN